MRRATLVRKYCLCKYERTGYYARVPAATGTRAEASERVRDAIVAATVRIVAADGVAAVTHRRVAAEAGVSLSSTTWHFATKADILIAALRWTASREVARIAAIVDRLGDAGFDAGAWAAELADWVVAEVTTDRDATVALYRLQIELIGRPEAVEVHREWGRSLLALGEGVLESSTTETPVLDTRLVVSALDGMRLTVLNTTEPDLDWLRPAVHRLLRSLLG
jgi:TetR/AcrR family transcriptional regulator, regulator of biofilm formation and stress response